MVIFDLKANAYNMACPYNQADIVDMAREFEQDSIISGNVPLSIVRQRKAEARKLSEQKDSSKYNSVSEGKILYEKGAGMPPYAFRLMDVFSLSGVMEIRYDGNELSIISEKVRKNYEIKTKRGKVTGIKFKKKTFVEK